MPDRVLDWSLLGPLNYRLEPTETVDTGGVVATVTYTSEWKDTGAFYVAVSQYTEPGEPFDDATGLKLAGGRNPEGGEQDVSTTTISFASNDEQFGDPVQNVSFRVADIDTGNDPDAPGAGDGRHEDIITVRAYDSEGNEIPVSITAGPGVSVSGNTMTGTGENLEPSDAGGSALVEVTGPVSRLEFDYNNGGDAGQRVYVSDIHFETTEGGGGLNGIVEGTPGDDMIDLGYDGDPEGDRNDAGDNIFRGNGPDDDIVEAFDGDDTVEAGEGSDTVYGGDGNDVIETGSSAGGGLGIIDRQIFPGTPVDPDPEDDRDLVEGGEGSDSISSGDDRDTIFGGAGDDTIEGGIDDDEVEGGDGNDSITDLQGADTISGGEGDDTIIAGTDTFSDYEGDDPNLPLPGFPGILSDPNTDDGRDLVDGGDGNDVIAGGDDSDTILGGAGNDTLDGGIDDDSIEGGAGDDSIIGAHGSDTVLGGDGDDFIDTRGEVSGALFGNEPDATDPVPQNDLDYVEGGAGNDTITTGDDDDTILGGAGDDEIDAGIDEDVVEGGAGNDVITGGDGADTLSGGDDRDTFLGGDGGEQVDGNEGGDDFDVLDLRGLGRVVIDYTTPDQENGIAVIVDTQEVITFQNIESILTDDPGGRDGIVFGTDDADVIDVNYDGDNDGDFIDNEDAILPGAAPNDDFVVAREGDDTVIAAEGDDFILGGMGDDVLQGNEGSDTHYGGAGDDTIEGSDGDDQLWGQSGDDVLVGGDGNDTAVGDTGADNIGLGAGDDVALGGEGDDYVDLSVGNDFADSGAGDDTLDAGQGDDTVLGGAGNDLMIGNPGSDSMSGGDGDDTVIGNDDTDTLAGNAGDDVIATGFGADQVSGGDDRDLIIVVEDPTGLTAFVDGNEGGDDFDTLRVFGRAEVEYDPGNPENGTIFYLDDAGARNGNITEFINIENVEIVDPSALDGVVEGTDAGELIDASYLGDPEGDRIDSFDSLEVFEDEPIDSLEPSGFFEDLGGTPRGDQRDAVEAGGGDDTVLSGEGDDVVHAGDGDDSVVAGLGFDDVSGGVGNDTLEGNEGTDKLFGQEGADVLRGGTQGDSLLGGTGDDLLDGGEGTDLLLGEEGADTLLGGDGDDTLEGGDGNDSIDGGLGDDLIDTGEGSNFTDAGLGDNTVVAGAGSDTLLGGIGDDSISGGGGDDVVVGNGGQDTLDGGEGNDAVTGGTPGVTGIDAVGATPDVLSGGAGNDSLDGSSGSDEIGGGAGNDQLTGGTAGDSMDGGDGDDVIYGDSEYDVLAGAFVAQDQTFLDGIAAEGADDTITGGAGDDQIFGEFGADSIEGGTGGDTITGGEGADTLSGGDDEDVFLGADAGDVIAGGDGGVDFDTLDMRGSGPFRLTDLVEDTDGNGLDGTIEFLDSPGGAVTGTATFTNIEEIICFTPGTVIATPRGERLVEDLKAGDRVITRDNGIQEIAWTGTKALTGHQLARMPHLRPILIQAGSLGNGLPEQDLLVSPNHRVLVANDKTALYFDESEVLVAAKHLTGLEGVDEVTSLGVTYVHFMFERHEVVLSNGAWTESFQPGDHSLKGIGNAQRAEIFELFPELEREGTVAGGFGAARRVLKRHEASLLAK